MLEIAFEPAALFVAFLAVVGAAMRAVPHRHNRKLFCFVFAFLLAPTILPTGSYGFVVPFGALVGYVFSTGEGGQLAEWVIGLFPLHVVSFGLTGTVAYFVFNKLVSSHTQHGSAT